MQRSFGITLVGSLFVFSSGLTLLTIIIEIIDSVSKFGLDSLAVESLISTQGLVRYFLFPIVLYNIGIGLLLLQPWARRTVVYILPFAFVFLLANENTLLFWLFLVLTLVFYFTRVEVKRQFS